MQKPHRGGRGATGAGDVEMVGVRCRGCPEGWARQLHQPPRAALGSLLPSTSLSASESSRGKGCSREEGAEAATWPWASLFWREIALWDLAEPEAASVLRLWGRGAVGQTAAQRIPQRTHVAWVWRGPHIILSPGLACRRRAGAACRTRWGPGPHLHFCAGKRRRISSATSSPNPPPPF